MQVQHTRVINGTVARLQRHTDIILANLPFEVPYPVQCMAILGA